MHTWGVEVCKHTPHTSGRRTALTCTNSYSRRPMLSGHRMSRRVHGHNAHVRTCTQNARIEGMPTHTSTHAYPHQYPCLPTPVPMPTHTSTHAYPHQYPCLPTPVPMPTHTSTHAYPHQYPCLPTPVPMPTHTSTHAHTSTQTPIHPKNTSVHNKHMMVSPVLP